jgi:hypothetical protein
VRDQIDSLISLPLIEREPDPLGSKERYSLVTQAVQPHHSTIVVCEAAPPFVKAGEKDALPDTRPVLFNWGDLLCCWQVR